jgi:hypothetical protein
MVAEAGEWAQGVPVEVRKIGSVGAILLKNKYVTK